MKDWTGNSKTTFTTLGASNHSDYERAENDFYATSPKAIDELFKVIDKPTEVWECACGAGHLSKRMRELGVKVYSSDLIDRGYGTPGIDFLAMCNLVAPVIVTNPPYRYAKEFVLHALELGAEMVCMFLKLTFLEGVGRQELFQKYPPAQSQSSLAEYKLPVTATQRCSKRVPQLAMLGSSGRKATPANQR